MSGWEAAMSQIEDSGISEASPSSSPQKKAATPQVEDDRTLDVTPQKMTDASKNPWTTSPPPTSPEDSSNPWTTSPTKEESSPEKSPEKKLTEVKESPDSESPWNAEAFDEEEVLEDADQASSQKESTQESEGRKAPPSPARKSLPLKKTATVSKTVSLKKGDPEQINIGAREGSPASGDVYVRADGKRVRRVKKKKIVDDATEFTELTTATGASRKFTESIPTVISGVRSAAAAALQAENALAADESEHFVDNTQQNDTSRSNDNSSPAKMRTKEKVPSSPRTPSREVSRHSSRSPRRRLDNSPQQIQQRKQAADRVFRAAAKALAKSPEKGVVRTKKRSDSPSMASKIKLSSGKDTPEKGTTRTNSLSSNRSSSEKNDEGLIEAAEANVKALERKGDQGEEETEPSKESQPKTLDELKAEKNPPAAPSLFALSSKKKKKSVERLNPFEKSPQRTKPKNNASNDEVEAAAPAPLPPPLPTKTPPSPPLPTESAASSPSASDGVNAAGNLEESAPVAKQREMTKELPAPPVEPNNTVKKQPQAPSKSKEVPMERTIQTSNSYQDPENQQKPDSEIGRTNTSSFTHYESQEEGALQPKNLRQKAKAQLSQSLMARTRSRAEVDSVAVGGGGTVDSKRGPRSHSPADLSQISEDGAYIIQSKLARKRVKVVQLLVFGLIGVIGGFFGSIFVQSSCHFVTADVEVGANGNLFELHYGMWKYSPIDSAFLGYSYCSKYDDEYTGDSPHIARIAGLIGLVFGSFALSVLWVYLILGSTSERIWRYSIRALILAGVTQAITLTMFFGAICKRDTCYWGPGAKYSLVSSIVWILVAYEMWHNAPTPASLMGKGDDAVQANIMALEMSDFTHGAESFLNRAISPENNGTMPSLNRVQRERGVVTSPVPLPYEPPSMESHTVGDTTMGGDTALYSADSSYTDYTRSTTGYIS